MGEIYNMKHLVFTLMIGLFGAYSALAITNYIFDVELPDTGETYSLRLDSSGHAKREYDAFVKYATEFEVDDTARATKWGERGIGTFIEVTATPDDRDIEIAVSFEKAEFLGLNTYDVKGHKVKQPIFDSKNTTTQIRVWPGQWVSFDVVRFRIRKEVPQPAGGAYGSPEAGSPPAHP